MYQFSVVPEANSEERKQSCQEPLFIPSIRSSFEIPIRTRPFQNGGKMPVC